MNIKSPICHEWHGKPEVNPRTKRKIQKGKLAYNQLLLECGEPPANVRYEPTQEAICKEWIQNSFINPRSKRKIKQDAGVYKNLELECQKYIYEMIQAGQLPTNALPQAIPPSISISGASPIAPSSGLRNFPLTKRGEDGYGNIEFVFNIPNVGSNKLLPRKKRVLANTYPYIVKYKREELANQAFDQPEPLEVKYIDDIKAEAGKNFVRSTKRFSDNIWVLHSVQPNIPAEVLQDGNGKVIYSIYANNGIISKIVGKEDNSTKKYFILPRNNCYSKIGERPSELFVYRGDGIDPDMLNDSFDKDERGFYKNIAIQRIDSLFNFDSTIDKKFDNIFDAFELFSNTFKEVYDSCIHIIDKNTILYRNDMFPIGFHRANIPYSLLNFYSGKFKYHMGLLLNFTEIVFRHKKGILGNDTGPAVVYIDRTTGRIIGKEYWKNGFRAVNNRGIHSISYDVFGNVIEEISL